jgi:hypothetical protein
VVLWVSHIVVAHRKSNPQGEVHLRPLAWHPDPPNPERSEEEALDKASNLAERLIRHPQEFEAAARQSSDDVITRDAGGSLGGVRATQLPPSYLDVLAALHPGEVSRVIRTRWGFTILMLRAPPPDGELAANRILFRHREGFAAPTDARVERTRAEARALAQQAVTELRSGAARFDALLARSDSAAGMRSGDIGVWNARDPANLPRQIEAIARLRVGEISDPIETVFGFEVLQRTEVTPRPRYAMQSIQIHSEEKLDSVDGVAPLTPAALAESLATRLVHSPELFDSLLEEYCCARPQKWTRGRGPAGLEPVLDQLAVGEIAKKPFLSGWHYFIPRRLDASSLPDEPSPLYELPAPAAAQLSPMVEDGEGGFLAQRTRELAKEAVTTMKLEPSQSAELARLFEELAKAFEAHPGPDDGPVRVQSLEATQAAFFNALGPSEHRRLNDVIDAWIARQIFNGPT